jgi:hypothetical protein
MRIAKGIACVVLALILLWGAVATWLHLRGPDDGQAAALATLAVKLPPLPSDRNVADDARLQGHVVPPARRSEALDAVRRQDARHRQLLEQGRIETKHFDEDGLEAFPVLPEAGESDAKCDRREPDCLGRVRTDPAATAALLQAHAQRVRDALALADNDGYRLERAPSLFASISIPSDDRDLALTALAARFAQGDSAGALSGTCRDLAGWRRIGANSDSLVGTMAAAAHAEQAVRMLARLAAALPAGAPLPADCAPALAPTTDAELDLCPAMGGEFEQVNSAADLEPPPQASLADRIVLRAVDRERMAYLIAPHYAQFCGAKILAQARADRPFGRTRWPQYACPRWQFVFDPIDCILVDVTASSDEAITRSLDRRLDVAASIALLRTALWLRDTDADPRSRAQRLRERPASLGLRRDVRLEGDTLVIDRHDTHLDPTLALPLPPLAAAAPTPR